MSHPLIVQVREILTNLIGIFENPSLDFSKNRADGDDIRWSYPRGVNFSGMWRVQRLDQINA